MNYTVVSKSDISSRAAEIPAGIKNAALLTGEKTGPYSTMVVVAENILAKAEVHEHAADAWLVLRGSGTFILGGTMLNQTLHKEHEWVADEIEGGERIEVNEGDVIDIPPGVPHQIDARNGRLELFIVKVNNLSV